MSEPTYTKGEVYTPQIRKTGINNEFIQTKSIEQWKQTKIDIHKQPTIFLLLAK